MIMDIPANVSLPLLGIGLFTLLLSLAFCCYMWRLKKQARVELGYKRIKYSPKGKKNPYETCPVCLDDFCLKEKILICPCEHMFHTKCLLVWLQHRNTCPVCKAEVRTVHNRTRLISNTSQALSTSTLPAPAVVVHGDDSVNRPPFNQSRLTMVLLTDPRV